MITSILVFMNLRVVFLVCFLLVLTPVLAQDSVPVSVVSQTDFIRPVEQIVVKEHLLTKQELKDHLDQKSLEYYNYVDDRLLEVFGDISELIDSKILFFAVKFAGLVFFTVVFSGACWYLIKLQFEKRMKEIRVLNQRIREMELVIEKKPLTPLPPLPDLSVSVDQSSSGVVEKDFFSDLSKDFEGLRDGFRKQR